MATRSLYFFSGIIPAFLFSSYLINFYRSSFSLILICLSFQVIFSMVFSVIFQSDLLRLSLRKDWLSIAILFVAVSLPISAATLSFNHPKLFDSRLILMDPAARAFFFGVMPVSFAITVWANMKMEGDKLLDQLHTTAAHQFIKRNRAGILLAVLFFLCYFTFTQSFNFPGYYTRDYFFEADISDWINNLTTTPTGEMKAIRAVHPAFMLFVQPFILLFSFFLNGDRLQAAFLLNALAGSAGVFMVWLIVKQRTNSTSHALISASLMGASASHILLSSMLETYIYSSLALIGFCLLLQSGKKSLRSTIPMGVVIFGITITNLAQACILYFLQTPRLKVILKFLTAVILVTFVLNLVQIRWYANARLLSPINLTSEGKYRSKIFESSWHMMGRVNLITRGVFLYGVVAPQPFILTEELGTVAPNFRTFKFSFEHVDVAGYKGLSDIVVKSWMFILLLAFIRFIPDLVRAPRKNVFPLALTFCLGFNLALHILYGDDPMLYTPDWTYALVLFVSVSLEKWSGSKWLQVGLLVFFAMLTINNIGLMQHILEISLPFYGN